jgi:putative sigma-54 modulation protein
MQINISGHGLEVSAPLRDYVQEKVSKLEEYFKNIQKVEVVLDARSIDNVDKRQVAEIRAWMAGLKMVQAKEAGRDMYAAVDMALDETKRQIEKHKEKLGHEKIRKSRKWKLLSRLFGNRDQEL